MILFLRDRVSSFGPALAGLRHVLRTQPNAWLHAAISLAVILLGLWLQLDFPSWTLLIAMMGLVWVTEFINTALEAVVDLASPGQHELAKIAKDVSAAAVVIAALAAVVVGLLVLGPPLFSHLNLSL